MKISRETVGSIILVVFAIGVISFGVFVLFSRTLHSALDYDELQHIHIAWHISNGKIIYADFFEHHGPLFGLLNGFLVNLLDLEPGFGMIYFLRFMAFGLSLGMLLLTFLIARRFLDSPALGLCATAVLSMLVFYQDKSIEIRPDVLQNFFSLAAVSVVVTNLNRESKARNVISGVLCGCMLMCNTKALPIFVAIASFVIIDEMIAKKTVVSLARRLLAFVLPVVGVFLLFALYFTFNRALGEFIFYVFQCPFMLLATNPPDLPSEYLTFFLEKQRIVLIAGIIGVLFLAVTVWRGFVRRENIRLQLFFLILFCIPAATGVLALYKQHYLMFLPFFAMIGIYGISSCVQFLDRYIKNWFFRFGLLCVCIGTLFVSLYLVSSRTMLLSADEERLTEQKSLTEFIVRNVNRDEKILIVWTDAGGYMFNEDVQYFWTASEDSSTLFRRITGREVFGENLIRLIEEEHIRYVISWPWDFTKSWPDGMVFGYVQMNFQQHDRFFALWMRD